jgi:hypothetical protein
MAIEINHRFLNSLIPKEDEYSGIDVLIIGTFNPGLPDTQLMTKTEREDFKRIEKSTRFVNINSVMNFYDRPQNRFWGIMDRIANKEFYKKNGEKSRNRNGLKHFKGEDRSTVYKRQKKFCIANGIFITDIVYKISPASFSGIYENFSDTVIEKANPEFNTDKIVAIIEKYQPNKILVNFDFDSKSIPRISNEIRTIKNLNPVRTTSIMSPSGAAGRKYIELLPEWKKQIVMS